MFNLIAAAVIFALAIAMLVTEDNESRKSGLLFGLIFGVLLATNLSLGLFKIYSPSRLTESKLIEECEATLPRDKNCVIELKAVPK